MGKIKDILGLRKKKICLNMFVYNVGQYRGTVICGPILPHALHDASENKYFFIDFI